MLGLGSIVFLQAQQPFTISDAVAASLRNYPSVQVSQEQLNAAAAGIRLARTAYLPKVDALAQFNRATRNNVFGLVLPQSTIPAISGPVLGTNNFGTAFGSAVGTLVTWEPFDFGLRRTNVEVAEAGRAVSDATLKRTRFEVAVAAVDAYLTVIAAQETSRAAQAGEERASAMEKVIAALVQAELRPGADASRARAEFAASHIQVIQAEQAIAGARANLGRFAGAASERVAVVSEPLLALPAEKDAGAFDAAINPMAVEQNATAEQARAQLRALERSYFPRFYVQGSAYARGTGAEVDGRRLGGLNGLGPNTQNYALGVTVTFPLMELPALRAREAMQTATVRAQEARSRQIAEDLRAQWNVAVAAERSARAITAFSPLQVTAARQTLSQATARYKAGLANVEEVAEAQRLVTQSEIDDSLARLNVWRALLGVAGAAGDLQPFLSEATR